MSAPYVLTPEAQPHINEIGAYIAQDSVDAAVKVYDAFEEAFGLLAERPGNPDSRLVNTAAFMRTHMAGLTVEIRSSE